MGDFPIRKSIRLKDYDYSSEGYYFITICAKNKAKVFGDFVDGKFQLTECGEIAERNLMGIKEHIENVYVDKYVVMPDHIHLILVVTDGEGVRTPYMASVRANPCALSALEKSKQTVSRAVQQYKASVSRDTKINGLWHSRFYDRIIRDEIEYREIWQYIDNNQTRPEE